jgi:hypothetical protein
VDFGFNTEEVGQLILWIGSPLSIIGSITGGLLIRKIGGLRVFYLVCAGVMFLNIFTAVVSLDCHCLTAGAIMLGLERIFRGMALVLVFTLIMNMSAGRQAATNYAVLCSLESLVVLGIMPITGMLADLLGYFCFYLGLGAFVILTLISGHYILRKRLNTAANEPLAGV